MENKKVVYVYESPDKGKTVYRRVFGSTHETRELIFPLKKSPPVIPTELLSWTHFNPN